MPARPRRLRRRLDWLWHLAVTIAAVSQLAGVFLPLLEGRGGRGAGTHMEAVGKSPHFVHDESTCAACHVRSMHGRVESPPRLALLRDRGRVERRPGAARPPSAERASANLSRAPPTVI